MLGPLSPVWEQTSARLETIASPGFLHAQTMNIRRDGAGANPVCKHPSGGGAVLAPPRISGGEA